MNAPTPGPVDPVLEDRFVAMGLPPTEQLLDELDEIEPKIRKKSQLNLLALILLDPAILILLWQVGAFWVAAGVPSILTLAVAAVCSVLGFLSFKTKTSLRSLLQDRKSLHSRIDARLAEPQGDDV